MTIFELGFIVGTIALIVFSARLFGRLFGISSWIFVLPIILIVIFILRCIRSYLKRRRSDSFFDK